ncbi:uncharacterized protein LOC112051008 isoform X4 [Bicyclus anynana]|uniref:Uncharacterized protein LOC112051008 isoform X4 n=1 Tax=Bicyclus anynana TaxID=110368 RepID=A0ABM3M5Y9_BICAN|nr:uncharacterized protein LOC112051008 isoform X4 [Bicyclus anynana]
MPCSDKSVPKHSVKLEEKILEFFRQNPNASSRVTAAKFKVSHTYIASLLKKEKTHPLPQTDQDYYSIKASSSGAFYKTKSTGREKSQKVQKHQKKKKTTKKRSDVDLGAITNNSRTIQTQDIITTPSSVQNVKLQQVLRWKDDRLKTKELIVRRLRAKNYRLKKKIAQIENEESVENTTNTKNTYFKVNTYKSSEALPYSDEDTDSDGLIDDPEGEDMNSYLVFNDRRQETSPEGEPSTSTRYQTSRFVVEDEAENEEEEVEQIIIKEEVSEEEKNQCRLCLSVNRRMWELGENAPLYRKLLFETNQNSTMPSFIYEMLACWECHAELRKIRRFQDKVRRANSAFETSQNLNCQELSNLGTVLITEEQPSNSELQEDMIKQEPLDIEETAVPDPLDVNRAPKEEIIIEVPRRKFTPKTTKRTSTTKTSQNTPKRTKIDPNTQEDPQTDAPVDCDEIFCKVKIELEELQSILEGRRNKDSFKNMKYKCDSCVLGFTDYSRLQEHNASFHDEETGICSCDICERRFTDERLLATHTRNHFVKFVCRLCPFECYTKTGRMIHFRRHKEAVQSDDPDSVLRQKLSSMESTGESSHDLD